MSFDKSKQLAKINQGGGGLSKRSPSQAIALVIANPRNDIDKRIAERAELALASGELSRLQLLQLDALLRAKAGHRIGYEADELTPEEEETIFPTAIVSFMSGLCVWVGSEYLAETYNPLVEMIGDALRSHDRLGKMTLEELIWAKKELAKIDREKLPTAYHNRLDPADFIKALETYWTDVRGKQLGPIGGLLREKFRTPDDIAEEATARELEERQIQAARGAVDEPTLKQHLTAKASLEEIWGKIVQRYKEDPDFQRIYVKALRAYFPDDLDRVVAYVMDCFPRLRGRKEQRVGELAYRELGINDDNPPKIDADFLEKAQKVGDRIRFAFKVWTWLEDGHLKLPPEPMILRAK